MFDKVFSNESSDASFSSSIQTSISKAVVGLDPTVRREAENFEIKICPDLFQNFA